HTLPDPEGVGGVGPPTADRGLPDRRTRGGRKGGGTGGRAAGTKRKWSQVTRFTALFTTGMHGTEHCNLGAPSVLLFHSPISDFAVTGSKLQSALQLSPGWDWMLVTAFRSPATVAAFTASIPGSTFLACYFASTPIDPAARSVFGSATDSRFATRPAA